MGIVEAVGRASRARLPYREKRYEVESHEFDRVVIHVVFKNGEAEEVAIHTDSPFCKISPAVFGSCDFRDTDSVQEAAERLGILKG